MENQRNLKSAVVYAGARKKRVIQHGIRTKVDVRTFCQRQLMLMQIVRLFLGWCGDNYFIYQNIST